MKSLTITTPEQANWEVAQRGPRRFLRLLCAVACSLLLSSCGGSEGGIGGSGFVAGPIEAMGSIVVDGIRLDISSATITIDGDPASPEDLELGMVVQAEAEFDASGETGRALDIDVGFAVVGPVSEVVGPNTINILGQLVTHDSTTLFVGLDAAGLAEDVAVRVSGVVNADDTVEATRITAIDEDTCSLRGRVENLVTSPGSGSPESFRIRAREVDAATALVINGPLSEGDLVDVRADTCTAREIIPASSVTVRQASTTNVEGRIQSVQGFVLVSPEGTSFLMSVIDEGLELLVKTDSDTRFISGDLDDLERNVRVVVRGRIDSEGALVALRVAIRNR